jgi:F-type H+-transporting ATPase subunit delta
MTKTPQMNERDAAIDTLILEFSKDLKKKGQDELVPAVARRFGELFGKKERRGELVSVVPLSEKRIEEISELIHDKFHKSVHFTNRIDPSIIGGLVVRFEDTIIDESIKSKLEEIQQNMYGY